MYQEIFETTVLIMIGDTYFSYVLELAVGTFPDVRKDDLQSELNDASSSEGKLNRLGY